MTAALHYSSYTLVVVHSKVLKKSSFPHTQNGLKGLLGLCLSAEKEERGKQLRKPMGWKQSQMHTLLFLSGFF